MRNCFVPNCDSLCKNMVKRMMFLPPKNEDLFNVWKTVLPKKREFKRMDRVCERHFRKEDILTTWDHIINGVLHQLERGKPKLKANAVPSRNLDPLSNLRHDSIKRFQQLKPVYVRKLRKTKKDTSELKTEATMDSLGTPENAPSELSSIVVVNETQSPDAETVIPDLLPPPPLTTNTQTTTNNKPMESAEDQESDAIQEDSSFEFIYDDVYEVVLPCTMYGIHRDPDRKFIVFSLFDTNLMSASKVLYVDHRLQSKMFIHNVNVMNERLPELTVELLTNMLSDMDAYTLCEAFDVSNKSVEPGGCQILATNSSELCGHCLGNDANKVG